MNGQQEKTDLALSLMEDIESGGANFERIVLKASRLARITNNEAMANLLNYERNGYPPDDPKAMSLLRATNRNIPDTESAKNMYHPESAAEIMNTIKGYDEQIDSQKSFRPSGQWASLQLQNQTQKIMELSKYRGAKIRVVSTVTGLIYDFASGVYNSTLFVRESSDIFSDFREKTEARLLSHVEIFEKWPAVFARLREKDNESVSHALTSCRRIIDGLAGIALPEIDGPMFVGEEEIDCALYKTKNRIRAFLKVYLGKSSRYERLSKTLNLLYDRVSAGVHSDVAFSEAEAVVLLTYLFTGEVIGLLDEKSQEATRPAN